LCCWWWNCKLKSCTYVCFVFYPKIDDMRCCCWWIVMNSWLVVAVVVVRCCCWWMKPWVIIILDVVMNLCCSWGFHKNGSNDDFVKRLFLGQVLYDFECLFMFKNVLTNFGIKFGHWEVKIGVLGWKWRFSRASLKPGLAL
jgi:hypothetical protein